MTWVQVCAVFALCCSVIGCATIAAWWWTDHQPAPSGRHHHDGREHAVSATELLAARDAATDELPALPHPTRAQLRAGR